MGATDGAVLSFRQLMDNGSTRLRYNIVLSSDGYTASELPLFRAQCKSFLRKLFWTTPFDSLRCTFNVFALEVSSSQSGVDDPAACGDGSTGSGAMPATFFDSTMCGGGRSRRAMSLDSGLARNRVAGFLPEAHATIVLVNSRLHGGAAGDVAVFTTHPGWEDTALHEFGHVLGLADEYACYVCDGTDSSSSYNVFDSLLNGYGLPVQENVSDNGTVAGVRWASMVTTTTLPTPPGTVPAGTVGAFEGAKYYAFGLFRPAEFCKMRALGEPFCAVCSAAIIAAMAPWTPTTTCVSPAAPTPVVTLQAHVGQKVLLHAGKGGYAVTLAPATNLPGSPKWTQRVDGGTWAAMPATRTVKVLINAKPNTYTYHHTVGAKADVAVADLAYFAPPITTAETDPDVPVVLRQPDLAASTIVSDYDSPFNIEGTVATSISFGGVSAGNGWISIGRRRHYTTLTARLKLDAGYFGPDDDPTWALGSIVWTPTPSQGADLQAVYGVTFDSNGLCWLDSDPATVVDPNVGFALAVRGYDAIGQPFNATGRLIPTHVDYHQSISTIQVAKIPPWEWPVRFETPESLLNVSVDGTPVQFDGDILTIGAVEIKVRIAGS